MGRNVGVPFMSPGEVAIESVESLARGLSPTRLRGFAGLGSQRFITLAGLRVAPAAAAGTAVALASGRIGVGLIVAASVAVAATVLEQRPLPLHLMPIAGVIARHAAIGGGIAGAFVVSLAFTPIDVSSLVFGVLAGWVALDVVLLTIAQLERRFAARVAVIGSNGLARALRGELAMAGINSYEVVGRIEAGSRLSRGSGGVGLGWIDDVEDVVERERINLLVGGARPASDPSRRRSDAARRRVSEKLSDCCLHLPVSYIGANDLFEDLFAHVPLGRVDATWFEYVLHPRYRSASRGLKRVLGLLLAIVMLIALAPVLAVAAVAIRLTDGGPILYRQRRIGERGREFDVFKLRTMSVDGEADAIAWSPREDVERLTAVGSVLRRTHLDELPQLWNVVRGDMSLVGPRPERPEIVAMLEERLPFYGRRHLMRPGITGWAQVRCGYSGSVAGSVWKLAHDLFYLKRRSILFDLMILFETLATPVRDRRPTRRFPDEHFVLDAIREEDETGPPWAGGTDPGVEVERRRFSPREGRAPVSPFFDR